MDAALLSRWMDSCDAEAFRELAQKYMPMVYATCLRILREPADAEDITQECFETLAGIRKNAPSQLGPWLHRVATNRCLNLIRSNNRRTQREQASSQNGEHASAPSYDEVYAHVDACIADLPEQYRLPLLLHFFDGQTHDAIAQSLGISRSAVSHRIAHAVQRIREQLLRRGCITTVIVLGASLDAIRAHAVMVPVTLEQAVAKLAISGITHASAAQASVAGLTLGALVMTTAQKMIVGVCAIAAVITVAALLTQSKKTATPPKQAVLVPPPPAQTVTPETKPQKPAVSLAKAEIRPELIPKPVEKSTQPVGHLSVYVYDEAGAPAPGAKLTLQYSESTESDQTLAATFEATTDAEGFANLNDLPQGWAWLVAERGNTRSEQRRTAFLPDMYSQELALFLHRTGKIAGKVLNDEGQPLAGARVVVFEKDLSQSSTIEGCPDAQDTNSDGRFEFTNLPVGLYRFRAIAEGYAPGDSDAVTTDSNAEAVVRVALGSSIAGVVRDGVTHNVLPDFPIRMLAKDSNESSRSVETDSAGNFLIQELQEGTYVLSSGHDAMFFADGRIEVTVPRAAPVSGLEITAQTGVAVRGRVLREKTQTPVANAIVRASHATNKSISRKSAETDEAGHYEIAGLAPGPNQFYVFMGGTNVSARKSLTVPEDSVETEFDIHIPEAVVVDGLVLDQRGEPVAGASVEARAWEPGSMGQEGMGRALSNQDGTFSIVAIFTEPGYELVLMASSERGKSGIMEPIIVPEGGVHGVVLRLTEKLSGSIAGRVVNTNGEPVFAMINARPAGERLRMTMEEALARRNSEERWQASIGHAQTNIDGEFVVMSLREGEYNLFVGEYDPSGFQSTDQKAGTVMLQSGQHLTGVDLVLDAGRGDITGVVTDEQGRPVSGVYVLAQAVGKDEDREIAAMTDASGKFRVKNLQEELYIVRANLQGYTCNPVRDVAPGESLTFVMVARKEQ